MSSRQGAIAVHKQDPTLWSPPLASLLASALIVLLASAAYAQTGTLTLATPACTIASGASTCNVNLTWTTTNPVGTSQVTSSWPSANTVVANGNSGSVSAQVPISGRAFYLYNNARELATRTASASCVSGALWNGAVCQGPMSGTLLSSAPACTVAVGASTCNVTLTWTTTNPSGTSQVTSSWPSANTVVGNGNNSSALVQVPVSGRAFYLYNTGVLLAQRSATASCAVGSSWNGSVCYAPMTGTLTPAAPSCAIAAGASSCNVTLTWSTTNPVGTSQVTSSWPSANTVVGNGNNGSVLAEVPIAGRAFYLYNSGVLLAQRGATASCAAGTSWNGAVCNAPMTGTLTPVAPACTVAIGASTCSATLTWSTVNPVGVSQVTSSWPNANTVVGNGNTGSVSAPVPVPGRAFYLYNNGVLLAESSASATCAAGSSWNGTACQNSASSLAWQFVEAAKVVFENLDARSITESYSSGIKHLIWFSASVEVPVGQIPVGQGSLVLVLDLDDLAQVTQEGRDGYVTYWIDAQVGLGADRSPLGHLAAGFVPVARTVGVDDPDRRGQVTLLARGVAGGSWSLRTVDESGSSVGALEWAPETALESATLLETTWNLQKGEFSRSELLSAIAGAMIAQAGNVIDWRTLAGALIPALFDVDLVDANHDGQLFGFNSSWWRPFTSSDAPPTGLARPAAMFAVRGGSDINGDGYRDNVVPSSTSSAGAPSVFYPLEVVLRTDDLVQKRYRVEVGASDRPAGWAIEATDNGIPIGDNYGPFTSGPNATIFTTWRIGNVTAAQSPVSVTFRLYEDNVLLPDVLLDTVNVRFSNQVPATPPTCTSFTLTPGSALPSAAAGITGVTVTGQPAGCIGGGWSASGNGSWLTVGQPSGSGQAVVTVAWSENVGTLARTGVATIAGQSFSVTQAGVNPPTCASFTLDPASASPGAAAGSAVVTVTGLPTGCVGGSWSASSSSSWMTLSSNGGVGSGAVTVAWARNQGISARTAVATIAGQSFSVTQGGVTPPVCTSFSLTPRSASPGATAGTSGVTVTGQPAGCAGGGWSATGNGSWLTVSPTSGSGSAAVTVAWAENGGTRARTGVATIAGQSFSVTQAGTTPPVCPSPMLTPPASGLLSSAGAGGTFAVDAQPSCAWTASPSDASWIELTPAGYGAGWVPSTASGAPPSARNQVASGYDAARDRLIVNSGNNYGSLQNDTWVLADATSPNPAWTQLSPQGSLPPVRQSHVSGYDPATNRLVIHGGWPGLADTWVLTNANGIGGTPQWAALPSASRDRTGASAAYDAGSNRLIVFGGLDVNYYVTEGWYNDVWVLTDANGIGTPQWQQLQPTGTPPAPRYGAGVAYDPSSNRLVVLGGNGESGLLSDIWVLTHANGLGGTPTWTSYSAIGPESRAAHHVAYDPATKRAVIVGGATASTPSYTRTVWVLENADATTGTPTWRQADTSGPDFGGNAAAGFGFSPASGRAVLALGVDGPAYRNDVWTAQLTSTAPSGTGPGTVSYVVTPNAGAARAGTITVAGQTYSVSQAAAAAQTTRIITLSGNMAFGDVQVGSTATRTLNVNNSGNAPLVVTGISYPAGFGGDWSAGTVPAGGSQAVTVTFAPMLGGVYGGSIVAQANYTSGSPSIQVSGAAVEVPTRVIWTSGYLSFGLVPVGTTATRTFVIGNSGSATLTVSGIVYPPGFTGDWSGGDLLPGSSRTVTVTFSPTAAIAYGGTVTIQGNHTSGSPTTPINGTGSMTFTRIIGLSGNLAFGNVAVGTTATRTLTITNTGNDTLLMSGLLFPQGFATMSGSLSIAPGGSTSVSITFTPPTAGAFGGTIRALGTQTSGVDTIPVSGTGLAVAPTTGAIEGQVRNAVTDLPQANVRVWALTAGTSSVVGQATTNPFGGYLISGLAPGNYVLFTTNSLGLVDEVYNNISCAVSPCDLDRGTPVPVTAGATTANRNFLLDPGGRVTGRVTDAATGAGVAGVQVSLYAAQASGPRFVRGGTSNASGDYTVEGLATGQYFAFTTNAGGYTNEIFDDLLCPGRCEPAVATASGTPIPVTVNTTTAGRHFVLGRGGAISGTVRDAATGNPVPNASLTAVTRLGTRAVETGFAESNASGQYTVSGLPAGTYEVYARADGYAPEILGGVVCVGACRDVIQTSPGTPIVVTVGGTASGNDIALDRGGRIAGVVTEANSGLPIPNVEVEVLAIVDGRLSQVDSVQSNASGVYETRAVLSTGSYVAGAFNNLGFLQELYDNVHCVDGGDDCLRAALSGLVTPIPVSLGATTSGRNFALSQGGTLTGRVTDAATGAPLAGVEVWLYRHTPAGGVRVGERGRSTDANGMYTFRSLTTGSYVAFTANAQGYVDKVFSNVSCESACTSTVALTVGNPIPVTAGGQTSGIDFGLSRRMQPAAPANLRAVVSGFSVSFTWDPPAATLGGAATSYVLEAGLAPGATFVTLPTATPFLTAPGVPAGRYFVRVRAVNGAGAGPASSEIELNVGADGSAPLQPPRNAVAFMSGGRLTLTWEAPAVGGTPSGYVVEAGSAAGLSNIASLPVNGTSFSFDLVPPGYYFLRVRATSATRTSAPSNEVMIAVGGAASPPSAPLALRAAVTGNAVTFDWAAPVTGPVTSYRLEAGSASGLSNIAVLNTGTVGTSISFSGVPSGRYYIRLRGVNGVGVGVASNEVVLDVP